MDPLQQIFWVILLIFMASIVQQRALANGGTHSYAAHSMARDLQAQAGNGNLLSDTQALVSFKQRIEQDPNGVLNGWNPQTSSNSCDWYGITCANARVIIINLTGCNLVAPLPMAALAPLDQLQEVRLAANSFYGYGSEQVVSSACNTLTTLDISSNNLNGSFSDLFLVNCKTLTYLNLSHNAYINSLPSDLLGHSSALKSLDLSHNNFTGTLSANIVRHCGALLWLDLSYNSFFGSLPSGIAACSSLQHLDVSYNLFNGTLPADIFPPPATSTTSSNLSFLQLSSNTFSGAFPTMASCSNLALLDLSDNLFSGQIAPSLAACTGLQLLNLSFNDFTGNLPTFFTSLTSLQLLYLSDNSFTGQIQPEIGNSLLALQELDLSVNHLVGTIPSSFSNCTSLRYLNLHNNQLSGSFPEAVVSRMPALQTLIMSFNNLTGILPTSLSNSSSLILLDLSANSFTGAIPPSLCSPSLRKLLLADNELLGAVPLESCSNLATLDISCNYVSTAFPTPLPSLPYMSELIMWANAIEGEFPPDICSAAGQLQLLLLNINLLSGTIPSTLANCSSLEWLSLTSNLLTGSIPPEIGLMPRISYLHLGNNSLSGTIPSTLGDCKFLVWLDASANQLEGSIPPELAKQAGKVIKGTLEETHLAFFKYLEGDPCTRYGLGAVLTMPGVWPERIYEIPNFQMCKSTRLYATVAAYYFPGPPGTVGGTLTYLDLRYNKLSGTIPDELGTLTYMTVLSLSYNNLTGSIPSSLANLTAISILYLDHNNLQGPIPPGLSNLGVLNQLDLSSNNLSGSIPQTGKLTSFQASRFEDNPYLCGTPLPPCDSQALTSSASSSGESSGSAASKIPAITGGIGTFAFAVVCIIALGYCLGKNSCHMRQHMQDDYVEGAQMSGTDSWKTSSEDPLSINVATYERAPHRFRFEELREATRGFSSKAVIGRGGFGDVYKATLSDGKVVAVKKLVHLGGDEDNQGDREFMAEIETIGKITHRNLVPLLGYCKLGHERMLVYEYMEGGSLEKRLHGSNEQDGEGHIQDNGDHTMYKGLSWEMRKRLALGTAKGLNFLHNGCIPHIIHRDLKSANVLLDDSDEARVSDFGMARLVSASDTHLSVSSIVGTPGYVPPEYCQTFRCTPKGDVYSFGVILLELITGRRPTWSSSDSAACHSSASVPTTQGSTQKNGAPLALQQNEVGVDLVGWVKGCVREGRHREVLDTKTLRGKESMIGTIDLEIREQEMLAYLELACHCVSEYPTRRPSMLRVLARLKELGHDFDPNVL